MALKVYIAGPMRGIPLYNFPAFDAARDRINATGTYEAINPADLDREAGVTEHTDPLPDGFLRGAMTRDLAAICECYAIALLPGWQNSTGANVEVALGKLLGLKFIDAVTLQDYHETIVAEAERLVYGDRAQDYGHPLDECDRIGAFWSVIIGKEVTPEMIPLCMIAMKMSREMNRPKRDNYVDMAGYAECLDRIHREKKRRKSWIAPPF